MKVMIYAMYSGKEFHSIMELPEHRDLADAADNSGMTTHAFIFRQLYLNFQALGLDVTSLMIIDMWDWDQDLYNFLVDSGYRYYEGELREI